jgi:hypothetical protein
LICEAGAVCEEVEVDVLPEPEAISLFSVL